MKYDHTIHIVCSTDHNYIMPAGVMMRSASANNSYYPIFFHIVIDDTVTEQDKRDLKTVLATDKHGMAFHLVDNKEILKFPHLNEKGVYVTAATYYRLFLGDILPEDITKVLYLDCDMIVKGDLMQLYNQDLTDCPIAAVPDIEEGVKDYQRLSYPQRDGYFNAGMELINLRYWREHHCKEAFLDVIAHQADRIIAHDQDVMNIVFHDNKKVLPLEYNFQSNFLLKLEFLQLDAHQYHEQIAYAQEHAVIIHYIQQKPWKRDCVQADKVFFDKYRQDTIWRVPHYGFTKWKQDCRRRLSVFVHKYIIRGGKKTVIEEKFTKRYYHLM